VQFEVASYVIGNTELSCKIDRDVAINRALKFVLKTNLQFVAAEVHKRHHQSSSTISSIQHQKESHPSCQYEDGFLSLVCQS